jgi:hypothetical protein
VLPAAEPSQPTWVDRSFVRSVIDALRRVVPLVHVVSRWIGVMGAVGALGGGLLWWAIAARTDSRAAELAVLGVILAIPPAVLVVVAFALRQLAQIPEHLAALPQRARAHTNEMARMAEHARQARHRGWIASAVSVVRLWRSAVASRSLVEDVAPVAFLFSPLTLLVGFVAMAAVMLEALAGLIGLVWLVVG